MDVSSILSLIQQHWLEILIILAIAFILRNLKWIAIAVLVFLALSHFGYLDNIKELILSYFNSHGISLELLQNLTSNTTTSNTTIILTPRGGIPLPRG